MLELFILSALTGFGTPLPGVEEERAVRAGFDFERVATDFLTEAGIEPDDILFEGLLDTDAFVQVTIGSFDVRYPSDSLDDELRVHELRESAQALVDVQRAWFAWGDTTGKAAELDDDWDALAKWIKSWNQKKLSRCEGGSGTLYEQLGASKKTVAAQAHLRDFTRPPAETIDAVGDLNVLILAPTREHFLTYVALGGLLVEEQRDALWRDALLKHTYSWVGWRQIATTRQPVYKADGTKPYGGVAMTEDDETGYAQFIADRIAAALLRKTFFRHGTHFFEESLGSNLVIDAIGKNNLRAGEWKLEYKTSGSRTEAYERFVPGGVPTGGTLPKRSGGEGDRTGTAVEISSYRENGGVKFFLKPLQEGQKLGSKNALKAKNDPMRDDKLAHFQLYSFKEKETGYISAPFLGQEAVNKALPPFQFLDDYEDFFRAYRCAFLHWLQTRAVESKRESQALFAQLIDLHARREIGTPLYDVVREVYDVPLSGEGKSADSLEWRFLAFIKKGR